MSKKVEAIAELRSAGFSEADLELEEFDPAEYLTTKETIAAYLSSAAQSGNAEHPKTAMNTAARAGTMAKIAADAGVTREGAYKALKPGTKTQLQTALAILDALGMTIKIVPKEVQAPFA